MDKITVCVQLSEPVFKRLTKYCTKKDMAKSVFLRALITESLKSGFADTVKIKNKTPGQHARKSK